MPMSMRSRIGLCLLALASGLAAAPTPGGGARVAWSTYLRSGAGQGFTVIDELEHDAPVTVRSCSASWCQVSDGRAEGFVDRDALDLPRTAAPATPAAPPNCVSARQVGDMRPEPTRFCRAAR